MCSLWTDLSFVIQLQIPSQPSLSPARVLSSKLGQFSAPADTLLVGNFNCHLCFGSAIHPCPFGVS